MSTNNSTPIKNAINDIQNNSTISDARSLINQEKEKVAAFMNENGGIVISVTFFLLVIVLYFMFFYRRIYRSLLRMEKSFKKYLNVVPLESRFNIMKNNYVLSDFYVASSYKTYLPYTNYIDYASIKSIESIIKSGSRFIDLDIMNKDFNSCAEPVVCYGREIGNWQYTTAIPFREVIHSISLLAFSREVTNMTDPFYINLNFNTWYTKSGINRSAEIIKSFLAHRLLPNKYSYQGRYSKINIGTQPIQEFLARIIIVSSNDLKDTDMDELVNINTSSENLRIKTYENITDIADPHELTEFNKKHFTMVYPPVKSRIKENHNFWTAYYFGCQFLNMNYTQPDTWMISYIEHFQNCSFILKPYKLRYKPIYIKKPNKQDKKYSFVPKKVISPTYEITY